MKFDVIGSESPDNPKFFFNTEGDDVEELGDETDNEDDEDDDIDNADDEDDEDDDEEGTVDGDVD
jgi:hypothetical protein